MYRYSEVLSRAGWSAQWFDAPSGSYPSRGIDGDSNSYANSGNISTLDNKCSYTITLPSPVNISSVSIVAGLYNHQSNWYVTLQVKTNVGDPWFDVATRTGFGKRTYAAEKRYITVDTAAFTAPVGFINLYIDLPSSTSYFYIWDVSANGQYVEIDHINPDEYTYRRPIYVTNTSAETATSSLLRFELNEMNFNFGLCRSDGKDIVITGRSNGYSICGMWRADFSSTTKHAELWVHVPSLEPKEVLTLYMFWGNNNPFDFSDVNQIELILFTDFTGGLYTLDSSVWSISSSSVTTLNNYIGFYSDSWLRTVVPILQNVKSWTVRFCYYESSDSASYSTSKVFALNVQGTENPIWYGFSTDDIYYTNVVNGTEVSYTKTGAGVTNFVEYTHTMSYDETTDTFTRATSSANGDIYISTPRAVRGNTRCTYIRFETWHYSVPILKWVMVYSNDMSNPNLSIDTSELFVDFAYVPVPAPDLLEYGTNEITTEHYIHNGDALGLWYSNDIEGYMTIHFRHLKSDLLPPPDGLRSSLGTGENGGTVADLFSTDSGTEEWFIIESSTWIMLPTYEEFEPELVTMSLGLTEGHSGEIEVIGTMEEPEKCGVEIEGETVQAGRIEVTMTSGIDGDWGAVARVNPDPPKYLLCKLVPEEVITLSGILVFKAPDVGASEMNGSEAITTDPIYDDIVYGVYGAREAIYAAKRIEKLRLLPIEWDKPHFPKVIGLAGSDDLVEWDTMFETVNTYTPEDAWQEFSFTNEFYHPYYRFFYSGNWMESSGDFIVMSKSGMSVECRIYKYDGYTSWARPEEPATLLIDDTENTSGVFFWNHAYGTGRMNVILLDLNTTAVEVVKFVLRMDAYYDNGIVNINVSGKVMSSDSYTDIKSFNGLSVDLNYIRSYVLDLAGSTSTTGFRYFKIVIYVLSTTVTLGPRVYELDTYITKGASSADIVGIGGLELVQKKVHNPPITLHTLSGSTNNVKLVFHKRDAHLIYFVNDYVTVFNDETLEVVGYFDVSNSIDGIVVL